MFALNSAGISGSLLQMVNHGLSTGALFLLVGMLYERYHTRQLKDYGGLGDRLRLLACCMVFFCLTSIGLPGLNGFIGEALVLFGIFDFETGMGARPILGVVAATGIVLGAWYLLTLLKRVFFGPLREPHHGGAGATLDLGARELVALVPLVVFCVWLGVYPQTFLDTSRRDVEVVAELVGRAQMRAADVARASSETALRSTGR
jgi:NADH-quinone oxidoreductase subunit M